MATAIYFVKGELTTAIIADPVKKALWILNMDKKVQLTLAMDQADFDAHVVTLVQANEWTIDDLAGNGVEARKDKARLMAIQLPLAMPTHMTTAVSNAGDIFGMVRYLHRELGGGKLSNVVKLLRSPAIWRA